MVIEFTWNKHNLKLALELRPKDLREEKRYLKIVSSYGFRRYGRSPFLYGRLETLKPLRKELKQQGIPFHINSTVRKMVAILKECLEETRREFDVRAERVFQQSGLRLWDFQAKDAIRMAMADAIINANPMGLGKTPTALMALPDQAHGWIICPAVMRSTWREAMLSWRADLTPVMVKKSNELYWPTQPGEFLILNYEQLPPCQTEGTRTHADRRTVNDLMSKAPRGSGAVIIDEYHAAKSLKAQRTKRIRAVIKKMLSIDNQVFGLTGTPITNQPQELWTLMQHMDLAKEAFGNFDQFVHLMGGYQKAEFGRVMTFWGGKVHPSVGDLIAPYVISRDKASAWKDMPEKNYSTVLVDLTDSKTSKALSKIAETLGDEQDILEWLKELKETQPELIEQYSRIRHDLSVAKLSAVSSLLDNYLEAGEPVVVMCAHRQPVELLAERKGWGLIVGGMSDRKRDSVMQKFQSGKLTGVACTIQAAGVGITLNRASHMIFIDLAWNPSDNEQAEDRIHRIGQKRTCHYTVLTTDHPLERRLDKTLIRKRRYIGDSIGAAQQSTAGVTRIEML